MVNRLDRVGERVGRPYTVVKNKRTMAIFIWFHSINGLVVLFIGIVEPYGPKRKKSLLIQLLVLIKNKKIAPSSSIVHRLSLRHFFIPRRLVDKV